MKVHSIKWSDSCSLNFVYSACIEDEVAHEVLVELYLDNCVIKNEVMFYNSDIDLIGESESFCLMGDCGGFILDWSIVGERNVYTLEWEVLDDVQYGSIGARSTLNLQGLTSMENEFYRIKEWLSFVRRRL